jgi:hypothetical protein
MATKNGSKQADPEPEVEPEQQEFVSIEDMDLNVVPGAALPGSQEQLSFDLGSEYNLALSTLKLSSIPSLAVDGQFHEGDRVRVVLEIEVEYVAFPPIKDRGFRVGTERRHHGLVLSAEPVE